MMNMPAARVTDIHSCAMCPSGPILPPAGLTVLVGNLPQARMTDICVCIPPPPFGPGDVILTGSPTVLVQGLPASRMSDLTVKGGVITTGLPTVLIGMVGISIPDLAAGFGAFMLQLVIDFAHTVWDGVTQGFDAGLINNDWCKFLAIKWTPGAKSEGWLGSFTGKVEFRLFELNGVGTINLPVIGQVGGAGQLQYWAVDLGLSGGLVHGVDAHGQAKFVGLGGKGSVFAGDPNNPYVEIGAGGAIAQAEAAGDVAVGEGGDVTGLQLRGKASAEGAAAEVFGELNSPPDQYGNTSSLRGKAGGGAFSGGGELGGWGVQDKTTGRNHIGGVGEVHAGAGVEGGLDFSYGPPYTSREGRKL
ncbi:PAAR domain-containing protein [Vannielia sp. SX4]|uniref:PAAR domain-containing protein n=1 Tax=Vannielia sp. SX4 TaxID=3463852 RepID=UPI0040597367